jgi:hypothetical protein
LAFSSARVSLKATAVIRPAGPSRNDHARWNSGSSFGVTLAKYRPREPGLRSARLPLDVRLLEDAAMEAKIDVVREIAALKLRIVRQQKIVGGLERRRGQREQARAARFKLYQMLNRMDALEYALNEAVRTPLPSRVESEH